jgi:hypothetical protein
MITMEFRLYYFKTAKTATKIPLVPGLFPPLLLGVFLNAMPAAMAEPPSDCGAFLENAVAGGLNMFLVPVHRVRLNHSPVHLNPSRMPMDGLLIAGANRRVRVSTRRSLRFSSGFS